MSQLPYLAEKSATWEFCSTITQPRPIPAHAQRMPKTHKQGSCVPPPLPAGAAAADLPAHPGWGDTKRRAFCTFLFHVFELLPCKSQFAKKHDKIMVGPAGSAQPMLCQTDFCSKSRALSKHEGRAVQLWERLYTIHLFLSKMAKSLSVLVFSLSYLSVELSTI